MFYFIEMGKLSQEDLNLLTFKFSLVSTKAFVQLQPVLTPSSSLEDEVHKLIYFIEDEIESPKRGESVVYSVQLPYSNALVVLTDEITYTSINGLYFNNGVTYVFGNTTKRTLIDLVNMVDFTEYRMCFDKRVVREHFKVLSDFPADMDILETFYTYVVRMYVESNRDITKPVGELLRAALRKGALGKLTDNLDEYMYPYLKHCYLDYEPLLEYFSNNEPEFVIKVLTELGHELYVKHTDLTNLTQAILETKVLKA